MSESGIPIGVGQGPRHPRLAIQTLLLPGADLASQFASAARYGFDGVEVAVGPAFDLRTRLPAIAAAARAAGIPVAAICTHPIHDPLVPDRADRVRRFAALADLLVMADELGAAGVVSVPIRPPQAFPGPADGEGDPFDLAAAVFQEWAEGLPPGSARVFLEPLNRYEAGFLNRVGQAADLAERVGHPRIAALADLFHMNVEEASLDAPLMAAGPHLGHVHIADNNRLEPGAGCLDFRSPFAALKACGYTGYLSIECWSPGGPKLSGDPDEVLPGTVRFLHSAWDDA
jgi:sugar phosphate isomerase/epimerase